MEINNCDICNSTSARPLQKIEEFTILKCDNCSLVSYVPVLSKEELSAYYGSSFFSREKQVSVDHNKISNLRLDILNEIVSFHSKFKLLEVGSGEGHFLNSCKERGLSIEGVEISEFAVESAKKKYNIETYCGTLTDYKKIKEDFDLIVAWNVVEHFQDIRKNFEKCYEILKGEGFILIRTMNIDSLDYLISKFKDKTWKYMEPPLHTFYFSRKTIRLLLEKVGFKDVNFIDSKTLERVMSQYDSPINKNKTIPYFVKTFFKKIISFFGYHNHIMYVVAKK